MPVAASSLMEQLRGHQREVKAGEHGHLRLCVTDVALHLVSTCFLPGNINTQRRN